MFDDNKLVRIMAVVAWLWTGVWIAGIAILFLSPILLAIWVLQ